VRSRINAKEVLGVVHSTGLDPSILPQHDPRWARLRFARVPGVDLRDHFRGALIGGAIGDAMGRANISVPLSGTSKQIGRRLHTKHLGGGCFNHPTGPLFQSSLTATPTGKSR
jgi:hypothetical protein